MDTKSKTDPVEALRCEDLLATPRTDAEASDGWSGDAICVSADFSRELERENNRMRWLLRQVVTDLPLGRRDWLNPDYEREMRALANAQ